MCIFAPWSGHLVFWADFSHLAALLNNEKKPGDKVHTGTNFQCFSLLFTSLKFITSSMTGVYHRIVIKFACIDTFMQVYIYMSCC